MNLQNFYTPVDGEKLNELLLESQYNEDKRNFVVKGFKFGFNLGYRGKSKIKINSPNLKIRIGDETDLWNKVMKEVGEKRYAGPFSKVPFKNYIQSPIGLVPKDNGTDSRLIFHLSYPKKPNSTSINANTPAHLCKVKYPEFSDAILRCLEEGSEIVYLGRSDVQAAFRNLGISKRFWRFLILKARSPLDGKWYWFCDKNLPFGAAVSCKLYQEVSDCVAHIIKFRTGKKPVNYLDDYLFAAIHALLCNRQLECFLSICDQIGLPVSMKKTFWASTRMIFLGFLIDTVLRLVMIPIEKVSRAKNMIEFVLNKFNHNSQSKRKITVLQLQRICGFLNFLGRAILPGRAFTRRLYAPLKNNKLRQHHHLRVTPEMKLDLDMWYTFVTHPSIFCRSFMDYSKTWQPEELNFYLDASKNPKLGFGGFCDTDWMTHQWSGIENIDPSIGYLELCAITAGVLAWIDRFANRKIIIFTDNESAKSMVNTTSSNCKNCMVLICIIVLKCLVHNVRLYAKYVKSKSNSIADSLSRLQYKRFHKLTRNMKMSKTPTKVSKQIWPLSKIWAD